jgi:hypothetical protein
MQQYQTPDDSPGAPPEPVVAPRKPWDWLAISSMLLTLFGIYGLVGGVSAVGSITDTPAAIIGSCILAVAPISLASVGLAIGAVARRSRGALAWMSLGGSAVLALSLIAFWIGCVAGRE